MPCPQRPGGMHLPSPAASPACLVPAAAGACAPQAPPPWTSPHQARRWLAPKTPAATPALPGGPGWRPWQSVARLHVMVWRMLCPHWWCLRERVCLAATAQVALVCTGSLTNLAPQVVSELLCEQRPTSCNLKRHLLAFSVQQVFYQLRVRLWLLAALQKAARA